MAAFALSRYASPLRRDLLLLMLGGNLLPPQILLIPVAKLSELTRHLRHAVRADRRAGRLRARLLHLRAARLHAGDLPGEIQQAASIDGAGPGRSYWRIILPLTRPALAALSALSFTWIFNDLLWAITVLRTDAKMPDHRRPARPAGAVRLHLERHRGRLGHRRRPDGRRLPPLPAPLRGRTHARSGQVTAAATSAGRCAPSTPSYTVRLLAGDGRWAELAAWGPHGVEDGPSPLDWSRRTHFITPADAAPAEYVPYGLRPFTGADLVVGHPGRGARRAGGRSPAPRSDADRALRLDVRRPRSPGCAPPLHYARCPAPTCVLRWTELTCTGDERAAAGTASTPAAVNVPVAARRAAQLPGRPVVAGVPAAPDVDLGRGTFSIGSAQGVPGHAYAPWLAVQDAAARRAARAHVRHRPGVDRLLADHRRAPNPAARCACAPAGSPHEGAVRLAAGRHPVTPRLACAFSPDGLDGLARVWHRYERQLAGERLHRPRKVLYNSWEATGFDVEAAEPARARRGRRRPGRRDCSSWTTAGSPAAHDDTGGLGDWTPDPAKFPGGFDRVHRRRPRARAGLRALGRAGVRQPDSRSCTPSTPTGSTGSTAARARPVRNQLPARPRPRRRSQEFVTRTARRSARRPRHRATSSGT